MAAAVALGFLSHLVLDEVFSVDLRGARVNRAFGTALKLWGSPLATLGIYALLSYLTWRVVQVWPESPVFYAPPAPPALPFQLPTRFSLPEFLDPPPVR
jgi:hypothetical protein